MVDSKEYKKLKCLFCGYEQASSADHSRCNKCKSRRMNVISEFSAEKILNKRSVSVPIKADSIKIDGVENMADKEVKRDLSKEYSGEYGPNEAKVEQMKHTETGKSNFVDDIDKDILGDDDDSSEDD